MLIYHIVLKEGHLARQSNVVALQGYSYYLHTRTNFHTYLRATEALCYSC